MNKVILTGRIGKDIELKRTNNGDSVCSFPIAVDFNKDKTDWFNVVCFKGTADFVAKYFGKGRRIIIEGRLATRNWEDKNGNKRTATDVVAEHIEFGDSKSDNSKAPQELKDLESKFEELHPDEDGDLPF